MGVFVRDICLPSRGGNGTPFILLQKITVSAVPQLSAGTEPVPAGTSDGEPRGCLYRWEDSMKNRVARSIVGILALVLLGFYTYRQEQIHWHSADVEAWGPATGLHPKGFEAGTVMNSVPETTVAPVQMSFAPAETPAPVETVAPATPEPVVQTPRFDLTSWEYVLVNGDHSFGQQEPEQLAYLNQTADETDIQTAYNANRCPVDIRIAEPLLAFARGCKDAGLPVFLSSGYRSYSEQAANFQRVCQNNGVTDGKDANGHYITMPAGCSEHQTGLCCDITDVYRPIKNAEIENTATYQWLLAHCAEYGFIHRFPAGKEDITGVMYEPFHFRYVGVEAATYIEENGITLEEFWDEFGEGTV